MLFILLSPGINVNFSEQRSGNECIGMDNSVVLYRNNIPGVSLWVRHANKGVPTVCSMLYMLVWFVHNDTVFIVVLTFFL